ncbi:MATE family efflux transporter [Paenibacillus puldeungensis]|uniref:Probable multidrug resistance protein NorM n=1 Tax=Paenibacillus puldeungensis TaxID=696536 RepID=A0ABW3S1M2_9BACL
MEQIEVREIGIGRAGKSSYLFSNRDLFKLFLPLMVEQLLEFLVGLAASIMVAYVGEAAVSGVSLVDFIMALLINLFAALATGGAVIAGQYMGKKQMKEAREAANQMVWFVGAISIVVMIIVYLVKPFILYSLFGQISDEVRGHANTYLMIVTASVPFLALYNVGAAIFRTMGNSKVSMKVALHVNGINVAGNALLLYGLHFGTEGVAIPTLISRIIGAVVIILLAMNHKHPLYIEKSIKIKFQWSMIKRILNIGVPYGIENSLFQIGRILVLSLVSTFGTAAIAANAVGGTIVLFQVLPGIAINLGLTAVIARCVGSGDYEQAKYYNRKILIIVYISQIVMNAIVLALLPVILHLYGLSEITASLTTKIVLWHGICASFIWPLAYTLPVTFRASGDARYPMVIGITTMFVCRIVMAYLLGDYFHMEVFGTWVAMFIDWIARAVFFIYRYFSKKWMQFRAI